MDFDLSGFQIAHMKPFSILRERRVILGLTQKQVAERAGVVLQQYQKFESGERRIMTSSLIEALELDITKFFHGEYTFGEEIYDSPEGPRYKKTGKLTTEDVE